MTDDLIPRLRALMAEIEAQLAKLGHADPTSDDRLKQALAATPGVTPRPAPQDEQQQHQPLRQDEQLTANQVARDTTHLKDYVPSSDTHGWDEAVFLGTGDSDPLGHDALIRR